MAIWQFTIFFVPKSGVSESFSTDSLHDENGYFECADLWKRFPPQTDLLKVFGSTLGEVGCTRWESAGDTDYEIGLCDSDDITYIRVRVDVRSFEVGELKRIIALAGISECALYLPEFNELLQPSGEAVDTLQYFISKSKAKSWSRANES